MRSGINLYLSLNIEYREFIRWSGSLNGRIVLSGSMWTSWPHFISCGISVLLIPSFLILSIYIDSFSLSACNIRGILLCSQCLNLFRVHLEISYITLIDNPCLHNNAFTIMLLYSDPNRCVCIIFLYFLSLHFSAIKRWDLKLSIVVHEGVTPISIEIVIFACFLEDARKNLWYCCISFFWF